MSWIRNTALNLFVALLAFGFFCFALGTRWGHRAADKWWEGHPRELTITVPPLPHPVTAGNTVVVYSADLERALAQGSYTCRTVEGKAKP